MAFIALRSMEVAGGRHVVAGDPVPEAKEWSNVFAWIATGFVAEVPDGKEEEFVDLLRQGANPLHLAPASKMFHLQNATESLQAGAATPSAAAPLATVEASAPPADEAPSKAKTDAKETPEKVDTPAKSSRRKKE